MQDLLQKVVKELATGDLLNNPKNWDSLIVNRRKPFTYRVFMQRDEYRICLHKFDVCNLDESFEHPHPWPGAFMILQGAYQMHVGRSKDRFSKPENVGDFILNEGSSYSIVEPFTWHSVTPLCETYTIMVNGKPWDKEYAHIDVRTTKGKDLDKMPEDELIAHLSKFKNLVGDWCGS